MLDKAKAMVLASLAADALALGVHWIYDTRDIEQHFGRVESFLGPGPNSYHPTKEKGGFTHYGDQTMVLLESLAAKKKFDLQEFSGRWQLLFSNYDGYCDQATKMTLSRYHGGTTWEDSGSPSNDLAGASRVAPLVYLYRENPDTLVQASRAQTRMTHDDANTIDSAEYFSRVAWLLLHGSTPIPAMEKVAQEQFSVSPIFGWVEAGLQSKGAESIQTIGEFGQSCHTPDAFPGVIHLIASYENDLKEALVQSVMAGGDSAARGMMVGMILGAHLGQDNLPEEWVSQLVARDKIAALLDQIP